MRTLGYRILPMALAAILLGLPLLADGVPNPPTVDEIVARGSQGPRAAALLGQATAHEITPQHLSPGAARALGDRDPAHLGFLDGRSGVWILSWAFTLRSGYHAALVQYLDDGSGRLLREEG